VPPGGKNAELDPNPKFNFYLSMEGLNTLLQSTTAPHLLMMLCDTNQLLNGETEQILKSLFNILRQKQSLKIILTTQSEDSNIIFLQDIAKETLWCNK
jgi:hypothetical protein